ncbi:hypothetical protein [Phenylobacterium sp.]|uniref:hypothetical protein n=1 Tax=Phenylobacterium sp. TaxID=1871053 RepID=UPI0035AF9192
MRVIVAIGLCAALGGCGGGDLGGGEGPPEAALSACVRLLYEGGYTRAPGVGDVSLRRFVETIAANPNASLTWERDGETYVLHDVVQDKVSGGAQTLDFQFARLDEPAPASDACGPGQVIVRRLIVNGIELQGIQQTLTVDKMLEKTRKP